MKTGVIASTIVLFLGALCVGEEYKNVLIVDGYRYEFQSSVRPQLRTVPSNAQSYGSASDGVRNYSVRPANSAPSNDVVYSDNSDFGGSGYASNSYANSGQVQQQYAPPQSYASNYSPALSPSYSSPSMTSGLPQFGGGFAPAPAPARGGG